MPVANAIANGATFQAISLLVRRLTELSLLQAMFLCDNPADIPVVAMPIIDIFVIAILVIDIIVDTPVANMFVMDILVIRKNTLVINITRYTQKMYPLSI